MRKVTEDKVMRAQRMRVAGFVETWEGPRRHEAIPDPRVKKIINRRKPEATP